MLEALKVAQKGIKELVGAAEAADRQGGRSRRWRGPRPRAGRGAGQAGCASWPRSADGQGDQRQGQGRPRRRRQGASREQASPSSWRPSSPTEAKEIATELEEIEYRVMRKQVLDKGERVDGRDLDTIRPITHRDRRAAAHPRLGALHARRDPGAGGRHARHRRRRAADRQHRRRRRDHQVVHAALQLPAVLHRRSEDDPRHQPPRDRARRAGRAGAAAAAAALRGLPLHAARRLRDPRVERLVVDGHGLRRLAGADGCRRADARRRAPASRWA